MTAKTSDWKVFISRSALTNLSLVAFAMTGISFVLFAAELTADGAGALLSVSAVVLTYLLLLGNSLRAFLEKSWRPQVSTDASAAEEAAEFVPLFAVVALVISHEANHHSSSLLWSHPTLDLISSGIPLLAVLGLGALWALQRAWRFLLLLALLGALFLVPVFVYPLSSQYAHSECRSELARGSAIVCGLACQHIYDEHLNDGSPVLRLLFPKGPLM